MGHAVLELVPACQAHGVGVICWSPLAMGMLAGRYEHYSDFGSVAKPKVAAACSQAGAWASAPSASWSAFDGERRGSRMRLARSERGV